MAPHLAPTNVYDSHEAIALLEEVTLEVWFVLGDNRYKIQMFSPIDRRTIVFLCLSKDYGFVNDFSSRFTLLALLYHHQQLGVVLSSFLALFDL